MATVPRTASRPLRVTLPRETSSAALGRATATREAERHGGTLDAVQRIALAVTEAVTNSLVHSAVSDHPILLTIEQAEDARTLLVVVGDRGGGFARAAPSDGLGLGLMLMERCCSTLEVATDADGTSVRMTFALDCDAPAF